MRLRDDDDLGDLGDLLGAVGDFGGVTDDLMEFGVIGLTATATGIGFTAGVNFAVDKFMPNAPKWVKGVALPLAAMALGGFGGSYAARFNRNVGVGVGVGLVTAGLNMAVRTWLPNVPLAGLAGHDDELMLNGLAGPDDEALLGLGDGNLHDKYLGSFAVEEGSSSMGSFAVEDSPALNGYDVAAALA